MKTCTKCGEEKKESEFGSDARKKDGFRLWCKSCVSVSGKAYHRKAPGRWKKWAERNRFQVALNRSRHMAKNRDYASCSATIGELKAAFGGKCDICGVPELELNRKLHMDHDHESGAFRGFLCGRCNKALGLFGDSNDILLNAMRYLANHDTPTKKVI